MLSIIWLTSVIVYPINFELYVVCLIGISKYRGANGVIHNVV